MTPNEIPPRSRAASNFCALICLLLAQRLWLVPGASGFLILSDFDRIRLGARVSFLQDDGLLAIFGIEGYKIAPNAFFHLILYLISKHRLRIDELAERLRVLRRR
jgi:hypothetical protein